MVTIKAKSGLDAEGNKCVTPSEPIPAGHKVRYINEQFQAIPQREEWPEEKT
jgi:hypothetical protein